MKLIMLRLILDDKHFICELFLNGPRAQRSGKWNTAKYNFFKWIFFLHLWQEYLNYYLNLKNIKLKSLAEINLGIKVIQWKLHKFTLQPSKL